MTQVLQYVKVSLMIELSKQYGCNTCTALCCKKGIRMPLSETEAEFMQRGGTELKEVSAPVGLSTRKVRFLPLLPRVESARVYELQTDCGYLRTDPQTGQELCSAYKDPDRPEVCVAFKPGEYRCMVMRLHAGLDKPDEFALFKARNPGS